MSNSITGCLYDRQRRLLSKGNYVLFWNDLTSHKVHFGDDFMVGKILTYNIYNRTLTIIRLVDEKIFTDVCESNIIRL